MYAQIIKEQINKIVWQSLLHFYYKSKGGNSNLFHTVYQVWWRVSECFQADIPIIKVMLYSLRPFTANCAIGLTFSYINTCKTLSPIMALSTPGSHGF